MICNRRFLSGAAVLCLTAVFLLSLIGGSPHSEARGAVTVRKAVVRDVSPPLASMAHSATPEGVRGAPDVHPATALVRRDEEVQQPLKTADVEQKEQGKKPAPEIVASFDGIGFGFVGPQGTGGGRNPSDNSLAVGPDHIVQLTNFGMAVFSKKGAKFDTTGKALYGPVSTGNVFRGFSSFGNINSGDCVVRYDQLADRWLIVLPVFRRLAFDMDQIDPPGKAGEPAKRSRPGVAKQPGKAEPLYQPPAKQGKGADKDAPRAGSRLAAPLATLVSTDEDEQAPDQPPPSEKQRGQGPGAYAMCYAVSTSSDPLGSYYRYMFIRPLFPDYPRPAVWPDGYYIPTSTSDDRISAEIATQKHAYVADRAKMLKGEDATEQGVIINNVNFLNNCDLDGKQLPPKGAPNIMIACGGTQLDRKYEDDGIYVWKFHVDWDDPTKTKVEGPEKITVAPYHYLGNGQLSKAVPQKGTTQRLDSQGDKIMARVVYRRIGDQESIVAVHSIDTTAGGGGVRWYEFRLDDKRNLKLHQQGTYAPDGNYRWMGSPAMDAKGNIGIGYSFGGAEFYPGQRFAGRLAGDPLGVLTLHEAVLVEGEAAQTNTLRWEDFVQTAVDPTDDMTIWYVGDYLKKGATSYSSRIAAVRLDKGK